MKKYFLITVLLCVFSVIQINIFAMEEREAGCSLDAAQATYTLDFNPEDLQRAIDGHKDLTDAKLEGANLSGRNLSGVNFTGAKLRGANFSGANLTDAKFGLGLPALTTLLNGNLMCFHPEPRSQQCFFFRKWYTLSVLKF